MRDEQSSTGRFGTFAGVYTPSLLTILGVIMYLKLGWVVGQAGLLGAVLIILLAHLISVPTSLSIASLASNRVIGGGGVYYIISRSLGLPVGAAIGGALYMATALGTSLYIIGFSGTVAKLLGFGLGVEALPGGPGVQAFWSTLGLESPLHAIRWIGSLTLVALTALAFLSANLAIKAQYVIMAAIALSLLSLLLGASPVPPETVQLWPDASSQPMELVFAIFFPAVTGFTAGVAMSGDLKDPLRAIPLGTLTSVGTGMLIYVGLAVLFGLTVDTSTLRTDGDIWGSYAAVPELVLLGVWGATLSSAIGSMLGAPRILQALALDGVGPRVLGRGDGPDNEPRVATIATFIIAEAGILVGELEVVARVLTLFFLTTYGTLNLACALESWANPDFRPRFRTPALVSVVGAVVCFGTMFKVDATAMAGALGAVTGLYLWVKRRSLELDSTDIWGGIWQSLVRSGLYRLQGARESRGVWRPNVMVFGGHPGHRPALLKLSQWIVQEHGLLTNFTLMPTERPAIGDSRASGAFPAGSAEPEPAAEITDPAMHLPSPDSYEELQYHSVFHTTRSCPTVADGILSAADWFGVVGLAPNAAMLGWPRRRQRHGGFATTVAGLMKRDLNVLLLRADPKRGFGRREKLDVWWGSHQDNGGLMLMIAHFIQRNPAWARARVRVVTVVSDPAEIRGREKALRRLLSAGRVRAEVVVMDGSLESKSPIDLLRERSKHADLVLMGLAPPDPADPSGWTEAQERKASGLGAVLFVSAATSARGGRPLGLDADAHLAVDAEAPSAVDAPPGSIAEPGLTARIESSL
ncbi:MAG: hypothetical protein RIT45_1255 [Pseudomonadota bacterium]|jgi:amino acid transporter